MAENGVAAELRLTDSGQGEPVIVTEREASGWPFDEGRVSVSQEWRDRALRIYQVAGLMPLAFTRFEEAHRQDQDATHPSVPSQDR